MSKIGFHERVLTMWQHDLRLRRFGIEASALWLRMMLLVAEYGDDGLTLRMGSGLGFLPDIAKLLTQSETQLETQITQFAEAGLLTRGADGAIGLPAAFLPTRRQIANRINGGKGGRPPKRIADARQREALLPIPGGKEKAMRENPTETQAPSRVRSYSLAENQQAKPVVSEEEYQRVGRAAFAVAFDEARDMPTYGIVRQWIADAASAGVPAEVRESLIVGACETVTAQMRRRGDKPRHMGAFAGEVAKAIAQYRPAKSVVELSAERDWEAAMQAWVRAGNPLAPQPQLAEFVERRRRAAA